MIRHNEKKILAKVQGFLNWQDYQRIDQLVKDGEIANLSEFMRNAVKKELDWIYSLRQKIMVERTK